VSYATWPYDESTRNGVNTLRGRFGLSQNDATSSAPYSLGSQHAAQPEPVTAAEPYQFSLATLVRSARDRL
jgi:hypothetical protein